MARLMAVHFGMVVFVLCLSAQVLSQTTVSQNSTESPSGNQTTGVSLNNTVMVTDMSSSAANATTSPTGAAAAPVSGTFSLLFPVAMATALVLHCC